MRAEEGYILLTLCARQEGNRWAAECLELGTASCGDTVEEAIENIKDACIVHLNALEQLGERDRFFRENRIRIRHVRPLPHRKVDVEAGVFTTMHPLPMDAAPA